MRPIGPMQWYSAFFLWLFALAIVDGFAVHDKPVAGDKMMAP